MARQVSPIVRRGDWMVRVYNGRIRNRKHGSTLTRRFEAGSATLNLN
jgi:hypothetical protein